MLLKLETLTFCSYHLQGAFNDILPNKMPTVEFTNSEGSTTIPNHGDASRNHLNSPLQSGNQLGDC